MPIEFVRVRVKPSFSKFAKVPVILDGWLFTNESAHNSVQFYGHISTDHVEICSVCGRELTDPISVEVGIGPICCKAHGIQRPSIGEWSDQAAEALKQEIVAKSTKIWSLPKFGKKGQPITTTKPSTLEPRISAADAQVAIGEFLSKVASSKPAAPFVAPVIADEVPAESVGTMTPAPATATPAMPAPVGRVWIEKGFIFVQAPYALKDTCKAIPGRQWNPVLKAWSWMASPAKAQEILATLKGQGLTAAPAVLALRAS